MRVAACHECDEAVLQVAAQLNTESRKSRRRRLMGAVSVCRALDQQSRCVRQHWCSVPRWDCVLPRYSALAIEGVVSEQIKVENASSIEIGRLQFRLAFARFDCRPDRLISRRLTLLQPRSFLLVSLLLAHHASQLASKQPSRCRPLCHKSLRNFLRLPTLLSAQHQQSRSTCRLKAKTSNCWTSKIWQPSKQSINRSRILPVSLVLNQCAAVVSRRSTPEPTQAATAPVRSTLTACSRVQSRTLTVSVFSLRMRICLSLDNRTVRLVATVGIRR